MRRALINAVDKKEEVRVALIDGQTLYDLDIENVGQQQKVGNIYKGRIHKIQNDFSGVFIDYGAEKHGFLSLKRLPEGQLLSATGKSLAVDDLEEGQEVVAQVGKDERRDKGAQLSASISLPSRYLSVLPNNPNSRDPVPERRLGEAQAVKAQLDIPDGIGVCITKEGLEVELKALQDELKLLLDHWDRIKAACSSEDNPTPCLIHQSERSPIRVLRDYLTAPVDEIIVDDPQTFEEVKNYVEWCVPDHAGRVILHEQNLPIFSFYKINDEIHKAFERTVRLPSGGTIVIDPTEALVAIDVNTAQAKGRNYRETALNTNLEAVAEVAKQLRIRDLSGLIVVDLIGMSQKEDKDDAEKIYNKLLNSLRQDRATTRVTEVSKFGLIEIERQRLRLSIQETLARPCPLCQGQAFVPNVDNQAMRILRYFIEERALSEKVSKIEASASTAVADYLLNTKRESIRKIELERGVKVIIRPDDDLHDSQFEIHVFDDGDTKLSSVSDQTTLSKSRQQKKKTGTTQKKNPIVALSRRGSRRQGLGEILRNIFGFGSDSSKRAAAKSEKARGHGLSKSKKPQPSRRSGRGRGTTQNSGSDSGGQRQQQRRREAAKQSGAGGNTGGTAGGNSAEQQAKRRSKQSQSRSKTRRDTGSKPNTSRPEVAVNPSGALNDPSFAGATEQAAEPDVKQPTAPATATDRVTRERPRPTPKSPAQAVVDEVATPEAPEPNVDKTKLVARNDPRKPDPDE